MPYHHGEAVGSPVSAVHILAQDLLIGSFAFYVQRFQKLAKGS